MYKKIATLATAATLGFATLTTNPQPAQAQWWIAPAIAGGVLLGLGIAAAASPYYGYYAYAPGYGYYAYAPGYYAYAYAPGYYAYARPYCVWRSKRIGGHWRRVRICY